jgi:hypothetical protein
MLQLIDDDGRGAFRSNEAELDCKFVEVGETTEEKSASESKIAKAEARFQATLKRQPERHEAMEQ